MQHSKAPAGNHEHYHRSFAVRRAIADTGLVVQVPGLHGLLLLGGRSGSQMSPHDLPCNLRAADVPCVDATDGVLQLRLIVGEAIRLGKEVVCANQDDSYLGHVDCGHLPMQQPPP